MSKNNMEEKTSYLRRLREGVGMTQAALASKLGVTKVTISAYENGHRSLPLKRIHQLSELFGVDLANFIQFDPEAQNLELSLRSTGLTDTGIGKVLQYINDLMEAGYTVEGYPSIVVGYNFKKTKYDRQEPTIN